MFIPNEIVIPFIEWEHHLTLLNTICLWIVPPVVVMLGFLVYFKLEEAWDKRKARRKKS